MAVLSPIDLLSMSASEQLVLRSLTRHPQQTIFELASRAQLTLPEVEEVISDLLAREQIVEQLRSGQRVFSTRFKFELKAVRNMPAAVVDLLAQTPNAFLGEVPLTAVLSTSNRAQLLQLGQERTLLPEEVLAWQGQKTKRIWLVQQGLLAQTRLKEYQVKKMGSYLHRGSWVGLAEGLSQAALMTTYTAVTATKLLTWSAPVFFEFVQQQPAFAHALNHYLSQQLTLCQRSHRQAQSKLWVIEGLHTKAGVTTFAQNLAWLAQQPAESNSIDRTLFWSFNQSTLYGEHWPGNILSAVTKTVGLAEIFSDGEGPDRLTKLTPSSYAPQVQLDMLLNDLSTQYEHIICDTGSESDNEFILRLRGQAHTLITLTKNEQGAEEGLKRWNAMQPYSYPGQKRVLALQETARPSAEIDARFHLIVPADAATLAAAAVQQLTVVQYVALNSEEAASPLAQAMHEVYRRLSLNHAVALFVPSTVDVNQQVDNTTQVKETLSFLGNLFGGATSSQAEGAWRSEESGLVTEQVTIVRTFVSKKALDTHLDDVIHFATQLKQNMKQEAVAISVDNQLILV